MERSLSIFRLVNFVMNQVRLDVFVRSVVISCRYLGRSLSIKIALSRTCVPYRFEESRIRLISDKSSRF